MSLPGNYVGGGGGRRITRREKGIDIHCRKGASAKNEVARRIRKVGQSLVPDLHCTLVPFFFVKGTRKTPQRISYNRLPAIRKGSPASGTTPKP